MGKDFTILFNGTPIECHKKFIKSNFSKFYKTSKISGNQIKIQVDGGDNFLEVTKNIFQGKDYEITDDNFMYLGKLANQINSYVIRTRINAFCYKRECDKSQVDQYPSIQFLVEVSSLIRKLTISNSEEISSRIRQKVAPIIVEKSESSDQDSDNDDENDQFEYDTDDENDEDIALSLEKIGHKQLNKLFFFEIVNTLSTGFNSIEQFQIHKDKIDLIIQIIKDIDEESQKNLKPGDQTNVFLDSFINYVIHKYSQIKTEQSSLSNYRQETFYLVHYLLSKQMITLSQIHEDKDPPEIYFLEFYPKDEIDHIFSTNRKIIDFIKNEISESLTKRQEESKKKKSNKKNDEDMDSLFIRILSENIESGLIQNEKYVNIFLNDDIDQFKKTFELDCLNSYKFPSELAAFSCLSGLSGCSLIQLSAFFGSSQIFEFLNAKRLKQEIDDTPELAFYVIAGQHPKIIKSYLPDIDSFSRESTLELLSFCNDHHYNGTYEMILESLEKIPKMTIKQFDNYMKKCVSRGYFDIIPDLLEDGATTKLLLDFFCKVNNEIGIEYMLQFSYIDVNNEYLGKAPLEYCIENKNENGAVLLLKNDFINLQNIDKKSTNGEQFIHLCCRQGLSKCVSYLLRKHLYDVNLANPDGVCPIHMACLSGNYETVTAIIRTKRVHLRTKVKNGDFRRRTALHFACCSGNPKILNLLIDSDEEINVDIPDGKGRTPIVYAIKNGFVDCVRILLEQEGIDINQEYKGNNLLQYACIKNKTEVFDFLLNAIVFEPNQPCSNGNVILVVAIRANNVHMVRSIIEKFGNALDVNIDTKDGKTPLIIACEYQLIEIAKLLLDHDNIKYNKPASSDGMTPFLACAKAGNVDLLNLLLENDDLEIHALNNQGMSAMHLAFFAEKVDAVKLLIPYFKDNLNDRAGNGETLLQMAYKRGNIELSKLLMNQPTVDVNFRDEYGFTPLLSSVQEGNIEMVKLLISNENCNLNDKSNDGKNAFHVAVLNQKLDIVKFFIELYLNDESNERTKGKTKSKSQKKKKESNKSIDINDRTNNDLNALFFALKVRNKSILQELINCPHIDINQTSKDRTFLSRLCKFMSKNNNGMDKTDQNDILDLLLSRKDLEVNKISPKYGNQICLHLACKSRNHNIKLINKLLKFEGIDINLKSDEGTPLYLLILHQSAYFNLESFRAAKEKQKKNRNNNYNQYGGSSRWGSSYSKNNYYHNYNNNYNFNNNYNNDSDSDKLINSTDVEDTVEFWCDFIENPKLNLNKGGKPPSSSNLYKQISQFDPNYDEEKNKEQVETPLELSLENKCPEIAKALISKKKVNVNNNDNILKKAPFHFAIENKYLDVIDQLLLRKDIKINIQNDNNYSPLLLAVSNRYREGINLLLPRKDINVNLQNSAGNTPLHLAIINRDRETIELLLSREDVNVNIQNNNDEAPIHLAINNFDLDTINQLINNDSIDINVQNKFGKTPLFMLIENYRVENAELILNMLGRMDVIDGINLKCKDERTAFLAALLIPNLNIFNAFIGIEEVDFKVRDSKGRTALYLLTKNLFHNIIPNPPVKKKKSNKDKKNSGTGNNNNGDNQKHEEEEEEIDISLHIVERIIMVLQKCPVLLNMRSNTHKSPLFVAMKRLHKNTKEYYEIIMHFIDQPGIDLVLPEHIYDEEEKERLEQERLEQERLEQERLEKEQQEKEKEKEKKGKSKEKAKNKEKEKKKQKQKAKRKRRGRNVNDSDSENEEESENENENKNNEEEETEEERAKRLEREKEEERKRLEERIRNKVLRVRYKSFLHMSCAKKIPGIVEKLIPLSKQYYEDNGQESIFVQKNLSSNTVLNVAFVSTDIDTVNVILNSIKNPENEIDYNNSSVFDINTESSNGLSPLQAICQLGLQTDLVISVLNIILSFESLDVNQLSSSSQKTALHYAVENKSKKIVEILIENAFDLIDANIYDDNGQTPLLLAISYNSNKIVKRLLKLDSIDINLFKPNDLKTPLYVACENKYANVVSTLINDERIDPNCHIYGTDETALIKSIKNSNKKIFDLVLNSDKIDLTAADYKNYTALHVACYNNDLYYLKTLLTKIESYKCENVSIYLNAQTVDGFTPLHISCQRNFNHYTYEIISFLYENDRNNLSSYLNIQTNDALTPLHFACNNNNKVMVDLLIQFPDSINPNLYNFQEETPLLIAASHDEKLIVKRLLRLPQLNVNSPFIRSNKTPLFIACEHWNMKIFNLLFNDLRIDINCQLSGSKITPLMNSIETFKEDIFYLLLNDSKIDLTIVDKDGLTALHYACRKENLKYIKDIIKRASEISSIDLSSFINKQTEKGLTAFHYVCLSSDKEIIFYFLELSRKSELNIDINLQDNQGLKPLDYYLNSHSGVIDEEVCNAFLIEKQTTEKIESNSNVLEICQEGRYENARYMISNLGVDVNNNNNEKQITLLHELCQKQRADLINVLLNQYENVIDINLVDVDLKTPLHYAVIFGFDPEIIKLLLETNKCNINSKDIVENTALHYACEYGKIDLIKQFIQYENSHPNSVDFNAQNNLGQTPLHKVAQSKRFDVKINELLLVNNNININPNIKDNNGNTPLHVACSNGNISFIMSLIEMSPIEIDINSINMKYQTPLYIACMRNDSNLFDALYQSKQGPQIDVNLTSPVYIAALKGHLMLLDKMLQIPGIDLNCNKKDEEDFKNVDENDDDYDGYKREFKFDGFNLLHVISFYDSYEILKELIESRQFDINETTKVTINLLNVNFIKNETPLVISLRNNRVKNVSLLFEYYRTQLDFNVFNDYGMAAIHYCLQLKENRDRILKDMIQIDDNIVTLKSNNNETPLFIALQSRSIDSVCYLIDNPKINILDHDRKYKTILHYMANEYETKSIDFVLEKVRNALNEVNANERFDFINAHDTNIDTALSIACKNSNSYFVKKLIEFFDDCLDFTKRNINGNWPFILALSANDDELIRLLISSDKCMKNVDLSVPIDKNGNLIVHYMIKNFNLSNFELLIEKTLGQSSNLELDLANVKNGRNESILSIAIQSRKLDFLTYILANLQPDLNIEVDGRPLIFKAAESYDFDIFKLLLKYGSFDLNQKYYGKTLLHYCCESYRDQNRKVELLVQNDDVDVNCQVDKTLMTPLHMAVRAKSFGLTRALLALGKRIDTYKVNSKNRSPRDLSRNKMFRTLFNDYDEDLKKAENGDVAEEDKNEVNDIDEIAKKQEEEEEEEEEYQAE